MKIVQHYSTVDPSKCIACHICERRCPGKAIRVGRPASCAETGFEAPCRKACPAHVNVAGYVGLVGEGRVMDAYQLIMKDNPFPSICGRICTHPCEGECNRGHADKPIAIKDIKRFIADYVYAEGNGKVKGVKPLEKNGKSVGIVGAGPSGLTAAYYLTLLGYDADVYEEESVAGGVLAYGIPDYRLPKAVLEQEIQHIVETGVNVHLNCSVGRDITIDALREKHDAVYMATGTKFSKKMGIPGEDLPGVIHGLDFLKEVNLGRPVSTGRHVVVIGGGNTAMDVSRTLIRLGAETVTVLYRRGLIDMPAEKIEITEAIEEGVKFIPMTAPCRVLGDSAVEGIECLKTEFVKKDEFGRRGIRVLEGAEHVYECDMVIPAVSQYFDLPFVKEHVFETTDRGVFETDKETMMTSVSGVFAGGDMIRGSDVAVQAIADGKNAAINIDRYLGGNGVLHTGDDIAIPAEQHADSLFKTERYPVSYLPLEDRRNSFDEAVVGYTEENAIAEARRCLRCDTQYKASVDADRCLDCGLCVEFCPQGATSLVLRETPRTIDIEVRPECMEEIAALCKKAHCYPARTGACPCNGLSNAQLAQAIIDGAHTPEEISQMTGAGSGCGGVYCSSHIQDLLEAAGYPVQQSEDYFYMHNHLSLSKISQETIDSHKIYDIEFDRDNYFNPDLFDDFLNVFPKALQEKYRAWKNDNKEA